MGAQAATLITIDDDPLGTLVALGNGSLAAGLAEAKKLAKTQFAFTNLQYCKGTDTVGADTYFNVAMTNYKAFKLNGIIYSNSANTTGYITEIKVNGELLMPRGMKADSADALLITELILIQKMDALVIIPGNKADIEVNGIAVNADVVDITLFGNSLEMKAA